MHEKLFDLWKRFAFIDEDDEFPMIMRKSIISLVFPFTGMSVFYFFYLGYLGYVNPDRSHMNVGIQILTFILLLNAVFCAVPYIYSRRLGSVPIVVINLWVAWEYFVIFMTLLGNPHFGTRGLILANLSVSILGGSTHKPFHFIATVILYAFDSWNEANRGVTDGVLLLIPGYRHGPPIEHFLNLLAGGSCAIVGFIGVLLQGRNHRQHVRRAIAAVALATDVVEHLRVYDTAGVKDLLNADLADVDRDLILSLKAMNLNLELFRPFLPNFVIQQAETRLIEEASSETGTGELVTEDTSDSEGSLTDAAASLSEDVGSPGSPRSTSMSPHMSRKRLSGKKNSRMSLRKVVSMSMAARGNNASSSPNRPGSFNAAPPFTGRITFAILECPRFEKEDIARSFIEAVHSIANNNRGSIHNMMGNQVMLTWNATHRVSQPEVKAIRFVGEMRKRLEKPIAPQHGSGIFGGSINGAFGAIPHTTSFTNGSGPSLTSASDSQIHTAHSSLVIGSSPMTPPSTNLLGHIPVVGCVMSGTGSSYSITSSKNQHAQVVHADWLHALSYTFNFAQRHRMILVDDQTEIHARSFADMVLANELHYSSSTSAASMQLSEVAHTDIEACVVNKCDRERPIFEFVKLHEESGEGEWMYQLEQKAVEKGSASEHLNSAVRAALEGNADKARSCLQEAGFNPADLAHCGGIEPPPLVGQATAQILQECLKHPLPKSHFSSSVAAPLVEHSSIS